MDSFAFEVAETARLIRREFNRRATVLGATRAQWRVLARLVRSGDGVRQVELAEALDVEPITLCRMIDRLEEAELVERRRDTSDRRAWRIHLTERAQPLLEQLDTIGAAFETDILSSIPDEDREAAQRVLARVRANLNLFDRGLQKAS